MSERIVFTIPASSITMRRVRWLWKDRLPLGMFSLLAGREGIGKSCLAVELAARVTTGALDGDQEPAPVFYVAAEDSWEHTVKPRFKAAGADLSLVHLVRVRDGAGLSDPSLPTDLAALEPQIREMGVRFVVLDPIISRLDDGLDTHKDSDVRRALEPLARLAERTDAAILGIIHVNKTDTTDPLTAVMGSKAFAATARAVLFAVRDDEANLLCFAKSNLGPPQRSYSYTIKGVTVGKDPDDGKPITAGAVEWVGQSDRCVRDVLADQAAASRPRSARDRAKDWLLDELGAGPVAAGDLKARAVAASILERTLDRAADALNVTKTRRPGFQGGTMWALPGEPAGQPRQAPLPPGRGDPPEDTALAADPTPEDDPPAPPHSCQRPPAPVNGANGANGAPPSSIHASGMNGGNELLSIATNPANPATPGGGVNADRAAGCPSEPESFETALLRWLDEPAAVKP
jgi:hypothetical protein